MRSTTIVYSGWLHAVIQEWISANNVLSIVLRDNLHQPQYVEKLEKIIRFMIKEKSLTLEDLDKIWDAQVCVCARFYFSALSCMYQYTAFEASRL